MPLPIGPPAHVERGEGFEPPLCLAIVQRESERELVPTRPIIGRESVVTAARRSVRTGSRRSYDPCSGPAPQ